MHIDFTKPYKFEGFIYNPAVMAEEFEEDDVVLDPNFTVTGTGRFVEADESQLVGARHPDTMYLDFTVKSNDNALKIDVTEKYVLTLKSRGVKPVNNFKQ